jgi:hypothetical protein
MTLETKNNSAVATIIQNNNLENANAILGPFYQSNAETAAQLLSMKNVPVISPLSKDVGNPMLIYTRPYQQMKLKTLCLITCEQRMVIL